jgi:hypothetical protein
MQEMVHMIVLSLSILISNTWRREYIDWRWPFSCVRFVIMVFSAPLAEGGEGGCTPTPLISIYALDSSNVVPSTFSSAKVVREYYLMPLSPSLCSYISVPPFYPSSYPSPRILLVLRVHESF